MRFTQYFKILLEIASYPEAFFLLRYVTVVWWSRSSMLVFSTQVRGFKPG